MAGAVCRAEAFERDDEFTAKQYTDPVMFSLDRVVCKPDLFDVRHRPQVVDVPVRFFGELSVVCRSCADSPWPERTATVDVITRSAFEQAHFADYQLKWCIGFHDQGVGTLSWFDHPVFIACG